MSVQLSYKKQVLFFILFALILLSVIEVLVRIYDFYNPNCKFLSSEVFSNIENDLKYDICRDNIALKWEIQPLSLIPNQNLKTIHINSDGFRGSELESFPDYRIFVIGGSTVFGVGTTSDSSTIPSFIQQKINGISSDKNIEVINAGIPNAYSFTESSLIKDKLLDYDPDMLIIYDGWNDFDHDYEFYYSGTDPKFFDKIIRFIGKSDYVTPKFILTTYVNFKSQNTEIVEYVPKNLENKINSWKDTWQNICEMGKKSNIKIIIILQPMVGTGEKILSLEEEKYYKQSDGASRNFYYGKYEKALNELNSTCYATYDFRNSFDNEDENTIFYDVGHVGDYGNEIIGTKIFEEILPIINNSK